MAETVTIARGQEEFPQLHPLSPPTLGSSENTGSWEPVSHATPCSLSPVMSPSEGWLPGNGFITLLAPEKGSGQNSFAACYAPVIGFF